MEGSSAVNGEGVAWLSTPPHSLSVADAQQSASAAARTIAATLRDAIAARGVATMAPSAGRTPIPCYSELRTVHRSAVDWSRVVCVQLDEYSGGRTDLGDEVEKQLLGPLGIPQFLRLPQSESSHSMQRHERAIAMLGGIDLAIHGIGRNGHLAFNEPGDPAYRTSRCAELADETRRSNDTDATKGLTLGIDVLVKARSSVILATGASKRRAVAKLLWDPPGLWNPAGHLRFAPAVHGFFDAEAWAECSLPRI